MLMADDVIAIAEEHGVPLQQQKAEKAEKTGNAEKVELLVA